MFATALSRGRIKNPLEILLEDLEILHRDIAPFIGLERLKQFDDDVVHCVTAVKGALLLRAA